LKQLAHARTHARTPAHTHMCTHSHAQTHVATDPEQVATHLTLEPFQLE